MWVMIKLHAALKLLPSDLRWAPRWLTLVTLFSRSRGHFSENGSCSISDVAPQNLTGGWTTIVHGPHFHGYGDHFHEKSFLLDMTGYDMQVHHGCWDTYRSFVVTDLDLIFNITGVISGVP